MYTKDEIIEEIKRIAAKLDVKTISEKVFELNSMMPASTVRYYLGSWGQALKEAGLQPEVPEENTKKEPGSDDELLKELIRLHKESGETPTIALLAAKGRYEYRHYSTRWKSLSQAFELAKTKFLPKPTPPSPQKPEADFQHSPDLEDENDVEIDMGQTLPSVSMEDIEKEIGQSVDKQDEEEMEMELSPSMMDVSVGEDVPVEEQYEEKYEEQYEEQYEDNYEIGDNMADSRKIKFIPQTIKPKIVRKKRNVVGEPIQFRGLRNAPLNKMGVAFIFGMISHELGFEVEALRSEPPDCESRRCLDTSGNQWEKVKIDFEYKSSRFKERSQDNEEGDIIVCWEHDWDDCPFEVLELRTVLKLLNAG